MSDELIITGVLAVLYAAVIVWNRRSQRKADLPDEPRRGLTAVGGAQ